MYDVLGFPRGNLLVSHVLCPWIPAPLCHMYRVLGFSQGTSLYYTYDVLGSLREPPCVTYIVSWGSLREPRCITCMIYTRSCERTSLCHMYCVLGFQPPCVTCIVSWGSLREPPCITRMMFYVP